MVSEHRVAVVTGAASGIGWEISRQLSAAGTHVVLADRDAGRLEDRRGLLGPGAESHVLDVTTGLVDLLDDVAARHGRLDYVFNNAGVGGTLPFEEADDDQWRRILDLNLHSVIAGTRAAYRLMRRFGSGHIVNTASVSGLVPFCGQTLYNTTKFGVVGLSTSLRPEAARHGVRVSVVCPGRVATAIWGTPIRGERSDVPPPAGSEPADRAAAEILRGVARNRAVIVVPRRARLWATAHRLSPTLVSAVLARRAYGR